MATIKFPKKRSTQRYRAGEFIIALKPEMISGKVVLGYQLPVLQLLAVLHKEYKATVKTLWPVGVPVLSITKNFQKEILHEDIKKMFTARASMFRVESLRGMEWIDENIRNESRLFLRVKVGPRVTLNAFLKKVTPNVGVRYVERIPVVVAKAPPAEPYPRLGGGSLKVTSVDEKWPAKSIKRPGDWDNAKMSVTNIAILDSGCDVTHPAFANAVKYANDESQIDTYGHGTFVCGIIAGRPGIEVIDQTGNGTGSYLPSGMLPNATVWVMKVYIEEDAPETVDESGELIVEEEKVKKLQSFDAGRYTLGLRVLAGLKDNVPNSDPSAVTSKPVGIRVLNLSLMTSETNWKTEASLITAIKKKDIMVVASSGNALDGFNGAASGIRHPAALSWPFAVGALSGPDGDEDIWEPSCRSLDYIDTSRKDSLDVCAPGVDIVSALPIGENSTGRNFAGTWVGTSFAAPYVTAYIGALSHFAAANNSKKVNRTLARTALRKAGVSPKSQKTDPWIPLVVEWP